MEHLLVSAAQMWIIATFLCFLSVNWICFEFLNVGGTKPNLWRRNAGPCESVISFVHHFQDKTTNERTKLSVHTGFQLLKKKNIIWLKMTVLRDWSCILLWLNIESYHELYIYDMQDGVCINLAAFFSLIQSLRDKIQRATVYFVLLLSLLSFSWSETESLSLRLLLTCNYLTINWENNLQIKWQWT